MRPKRSTHKSPSEKIVKDICRATWKHYSAEEKIRIVLDQYQRGGPEALGDRSPRPDRVWNRISDAARKQIVDLALEAPELSRRELAVCFTDTKGYFVSEASVYRLLKAHDLITSPAFIVMKATDSFKD